MRKTSARTRYENSSPGSENDPYIGAWWVFSCCNKWDFFTTVWSGQLLAESLVHHSGEPKKLDFYSPQTIIGSLATLPPVEEVKMLPYDGSYKTDWAVVVRYQVRRGAFCILPRREILRERRKGSPSDDRPVQSRHYASRLNQTLWGHCGGSSLSTSLKYLVGYYRSKMPRTQQVRTEKNPLGEARSCQKRLDTQILNGEAEDNMEPELTNHVTLVCNMLFLNFRKTQAAPNIRLLHRVILIGGRGKFR